MQDDQVSVFNNGEQSVSLRDQRLIEHLEGLWKSSSNVSPESLGRILKLLALLPDPQKAAGMTKIAEYLATTLSLHFLDLLAIFKESAKDEGIDAEEYAETLRGAIEPFSEMMGISRHVFTRTIDDLVTLSNITASLRTLSHADSAEDAQNWIYELPTLYESQLHQAHLMTSSQVQSSL